MFDRFRLQLHRTVFTNYNKYLRQLIDQYLAGGVSEENFLKTSRGFLSLAEKHYRKAFALSRKIHGVPDETLHRAFELLCEHYEQNRYRGQVAGAGQEEAADAGADELVVEVANRHYRRSEAEIRSFVETALKECTPPGGDLNGEALFLKLLDGYLMDEFEELGESLQGKAPAPGDLVQAQLRAMEKCHRANPFCFKRPARFLQFRAMVEQNLNPDMFFQENISRYAEAAR